MVGWLFVSTGIAGTLSVGSTYPTIQEALAAAVDGDVIEVEPGVYEGPLQLGGVEIEIVGTDGALTTSIVPSAAGDPATISVQGGAPVTLRGLTIDGGGQQRALLIDGGDVLGDDLILLGASPDVTSELGIYDGTADFVNLSVDDPVDHSGLTGGHIEMITAKVTFDHSSFSNGHTIDGIGGAIYMYDTEVDFTDCTFRGNEAAEGGAVFIEATPPNLLTFSDCTFDDNIATSGPGGAVFQLDGQLKIERTTIRGSSASDGGGGLSHIGAKAFEFVDGLIEGCSGPMGGAMALLDGGDMTVLRSRFVDNVAEADGGAIAIVGVSDLELGGNTFCANVAATGGAVNLTADGDVLAVLHHNVFVGNRSETQGAAFAAIAASAQLYQNIIADSVTNGSRGAVFASGGSHIDSKDNAFVGNQGVGAFSEPPGSMDGGYNLYFSNDGNIGNPEGISSEATWSDILLDPSFQGYIPGNCDSDFRLRGGSPMIDAGDPGWFDDDGSRADMGAYGGVGAAVMRDLDGDGVIIGDCAPNDPNQLEGSAEIVADAIDQDCDGLDICWIDEDGDGVGIDATIIGPIGCVLEGMARETGDCDDTDPEKTLDCSIGKGSLDLRPAWFCSASGGLPPAPLALGIVAMALVRRRPRAGSR